MLIKKHRHLNRRGGSSGSESQSIVTNRPDAVRVGAFGPVLRDCRDAGDSDGSSEWRFAEVEVNKASLREGDFVAIRERHVFNDCRGTRSWDKVISVVGREVSEKDFDFGSAYMAWAEGSEREALEYLRALAADKSRRVRHTLEFAMRGGSSGMAPFAQRREAWRAALKALGLKDLAVEKIAGGSVRTATAKAALRLGWKPSVALPKFWKGLPAGVTEVIPDFSDKGKEWVTEEALRSFWDREWKAREEAFAA